LLLLLLQEKRRWWSRSHGTPPPGLSLARWRERRNRARDEAPSSFGDENTRSAAARRILKTGPLKLSSMHPHPSRHPP
jgi:hypothetical protein